jgi:hypothetical protein
VRRKLHQENREKVAPGKWGEGCNLENEKKAVPRDSEEGFTWRMGRRLYLEGGRLLELESVEKDVYLESEKRGVSGELGTDVPGERREGCTVYLESEEMSVPGE